MKKQILSCITGILTISILTGCIGSDGDDPYDPITEVTVCELADDYTPYIGEIISTTGHFENANPLLRRWRLLTLEPICEIVFHYDFGSGYHPSMGEVIMVIGVVQLDKVDFNGYDLVLLEDCYFETTGW